MKPTFKTILSISVLAAATSAFAAPVEYGLDSGSRLEWVGKKLAGQHHGTIQVKSGTVQIDGGRLTGGRIVVDMTSIKDLDLQDPEYNKKLVGHLSSDDFFGVEKHPESILAIKSVEPAAKGSSLVKADLTIKGVTHEVSFPADVKVEGDTARASGKLKVDRTRFGVKYGSGKFFDNLGDKVISDEFELGFSLTAHKASK